MTAKQEALKLIQKMNCSFEMQRARYPDLEPDIEVIPPKGKVFQEYDDELEGLSSLHCVNWEDVCLRLPCVKICDA